MATKQTNRNVLWPLGIIWLTALVSLAYCCVIELLVRAGVEPQTGGWLLSSRIAAVVSAICVLGGLGLACVMATGYLHTLRSHSEAMLANSRQLLAGQTQNEAILTQLSENLLLSDAVKSVAFREKDRTVLEQAIQQDIRNERWESALILIDDLAERFGCQDESKRLREELQDYQAGTIQDKINALIKHIESLWMINNYADAQREVDTLTRLYPEFKQVQELNGKTEDRRRQHKKELLERWDRAIKNNDIDQGVELLKLLDNYLTPTEGAALEESARGMFRAKLHNMGVEFSVFVTEKNWNQALKIGREIIDEFPNTRMAQEVRDKLPILQQRAQSPQEH